MWPDHHPVGPISGEPIEPAERPRRGRWYPGMPGFTPRSTWYLSSPRSQNWLKTAAKNVGRRREVQGCYKPVERGGRYCTHHRNHRRNYGHVTAKHLPRKLLGTWIVQGQRYIRQLSKLPKDHPARRQLL